MKTKNRTAGRQGKEGVSRDIIGFFCYIRIVTGRTEGS